MLRRKKIRGPRMSNDPMMLNEEIITEWFKASDERSDPFIEQMEAVLDELKIMYPLRVWSMRRDMRWLRKEAGKRGLRWGLG